MLNLKIDPEKDSLWESASVFKGLNEHCIGTPEKLYKKLDPKDAEKWRKKFSGETADI